MHPARARIPLSLLVGTAIWGCGQPEPPPPAGEAVTAVAPPELDGLPADTVQGWTGPGGEPFEVTRRLPGDPTHLHRTIGRENYSLTLRPGEGALVQYPCTSCHEGVTITPDREEDVHGNIHPVHPSSTGEACATCHVPQAVDRVRLNTGESVTLDHAYRVCAQCHFQQTGGWAAGIHGKRLYGWEGRRVVMNCADCHDPHNPAAEVRIPYPGPRLPTSRGGS